MSPTVRKSEPTRRYAICTSHDGIEMYSKIALIQLAQNWTGTKLLSIPYYQTVLTLTPDITGNCFVTAPIIGLYR
jgi:hypothetical protein